jgi:tetratricopeptide (TPR) repeat protein
VVDIVKLRDYSLNPRHPEGKHKARVFAAALGLTTEDAEWLRRELLTAASQHSCQPGRRTAHGQRYGMDHVVNRPAGAESSRQARERENTLTRPGGLLYGAVNPSRVKPMAEITSDSISKNARDFYNKALAALERNNYEYAMEMFLQCLTLEPNFLKARQYLRAAQMKHTESAGGFKRMMTGAKAQPLLAKAKMVAGKNPVEAMAIAEQVLSVDPKNGQALTILAEAAEKAGFPETTAQTLEHYVKVSPRDVKIQHWLAKTYTALKKSDLAREVYERLLQQNPGDFEAQRGIQHATASGALQQGGWNEAQSYRDVMKDKDEAVSLEQASRVVRAEDMTANLIRDNLAKLQTDPTNPVIQRELSRLYTQQGDFDTALQYLERIQAAEGGGDPTLERDIADIKVKQLDVAIDAKRTALAAKPANLAALEQEVAELERQRDAQLLTNAVQLVDRYPNDLNYRYDLAVLYMKTGDVSNAIEQFQKAVGQPQKRVASLNYLGQCFQQMGLHDLAVDQYAKAIEELPMMDGLKKELTYNLAATYDAMGEIEKAIAEYKKIAAVDFGYRDVRAKIIRKPAK